MSKGELRKNSKGKRGNINTVTEVSVLPKMGTDGSNVPRFRSMAPDMPRLTPSVFSGEEGEDAILYIAQFNKIAIANGWDERTKTELFPCFLSGTAARWLHSLPSFEVTTAVFAGEWKDLLKEFLAAFSGGMAAEMKARRLSERRQGAQESSDSYFFDVRAMCREVNAEMSEAEVMRNVMKGLRPQLARFVLPMEPKTIDEMRRCIKLQEAAAMYDPGFAEVETPSAIERLAKEVERISGELERTRIQASERSPPRPSANTSRWVPPYERSSRTHTGRPVCFGCSRPGHVKSVCPQGQMRCFSCNRVGHRAADCTIGDRIAFQGAPPTNGSPRV